MKVDNSSEVSVGQSRNSIRISTKDHFTVGSLWIADMLHVPYGVRVSRRPWSSELNILVVFRLACFLVFGSRLAQRGRGT